MVRLRRLHMKANRPRRRRLPPPPRRGVPYKVKPRAVGQRNALHRATATAKDAEVIKASGPRACSSAVFPSRLPAHDLVIEHSADQARASLDEWAGRADEPHDQRSQPSGATTTTITPSSNGHLTDFIAAYNFGRRLKTLKGLHTYEFICKRWAAEPHRFKASPLHQMRGLTSSHGKGRSRADGRRYFSRFSPVVDPRFQLPGRGVVATLERACAKAGYPKTNPRRSAVSSLSRDLDSGPMLRA